MLPGPPVIRLKVHVCTAGESVPVALVTTQTYCPEVHGIARRDAVLYGDIMIDELRGVYIVEWC